MSRKLQNEQVSKVTQAMASTTELYSDLFKVTGATRFRLLKILPGIPDTPIHTQLKISDLKEKPKYEALSYVWGEASTRGPQIFMNNVEVTHAHESLRRFLNRIRHKNRIRTVWVDALCINQQDPEEKTHQVQLMGLIYQKARCVLAWLGEHDENSMQVFGTNLHDRLLGGSILSPAVLLPPVMLGVVFYGIYRSMKLKHDKKPLDAWEAILSRPYFNRTWIIQEMLLAKKLQFVCGSDTMNMTLFEKPFRLYRLVYNKAEIANVLPRSFLIYFAKRNSSRGSGTKNGYYFEQRDIFELVHEFQFTECTELLDRVYGMLSLEAPSETALIKPDYRISVHELFLYICTYKLPHEVNDEVCKKVAMLFTGLKLNKNNNGEEDDYVKHRNAEGILTLLHNSRPVVLTTGQILKAFDVYGFLKPRRDYLITSSNIPGMIIDEYIAWKKTERPGIGDMPLSSSSPNDIFRTLDEPLWDRYETFRERQSARQSQAMKSHALEQSMRSSMLRQDLLNQTIQQSMMSSSSMNMSTMSSSMPSTTTSTMMGY